MTSTNQENSSRTTHTTTPVATATPATAPAPTAAPATTPAPGQPAPLGVLNRQTPAGNTGVGVIPKFVPALTEEEAVSNARLLKALADPTRLRILSLLSRYEGEVCVFEIVESFTLEQPTISHHLRILRDAGLVDCRKKGLWAYYYVRREALNRAQEVINNLA